MVVAQGLRTRTKQQQHFIEDTNRTTGQFDPGRDHLFDICYFGQDQTGKSGPNGFTVKASFTQS